MPTRLVFHCEKGHNLTFYVPPGVLGIQIQRKNEDKEVGDDIMGCTDFENVGFDNPSCAVCNYCIATELGDDEWPIHLEQTFQKRNDFRGIEKKYMDSEGSRCPYCDSENITADPIEADAGCASGDVRCKDCEKSWKDYYSLSGMSEDE